MAKVKCYNGNEVIGMVDCVYNLDYWDGSTHTPEIAGRHLGIGKTKDGRFFYLVHGAQWQGEKDYAELVGEEEAKQEVLRHNPDIYELIFKETMPEL